MPANLSANELIIVGSEDNPKWAVLQCPCGCGEQIDVNLMRSRRPFWRLYRTTEGVTLWPSLWVPAWKCGSHFWIVDSTVLWARFSGEEGEWELEE